MDWDVTGTGTGTVNSSGLFTAPAVAEPTHVAVTATSVADPSASGVAVVLVVPAADAGRADHPDFDVDQGT